MIGVSESGIVLLMTYTGTVGTGVVVTHTTLHPVLFCTAASDVVMLVMREV